MLELNELLVPTDFSETSREAFAQALTFASGDGPVVIVLHVIDPALAEFAESQGLGARDEVLAKMRASAERELETFAAPAGSTVEVERVVSEGIPFYEIVRKADDFAVDAVVMGKAGARDHAETLLFGSTAERVIRGCRRPVIVLPLSR